MVVGACRRPLRPVARIVKAAFWLDRLLRRAMRLRSSAPNVTASNGGPDEMDEELEPDDDALKRASWAIEVLTKHGCEAETAGRLAAYQVDHWKAVDMASAGCSWFLIEKILV